MDKTRLYFSITDAMQNKIANFPQFNKIDRFLTELSNRFETLLNSDDEEEVLNTMFDKFYCDSGANTVNGIIEEIEEAMSDNEDNVTEKEQWLLDSIQAYIEDHNNLLYFNDCIAD